MFTGPTQLLDEPLAHQRHVADERRLTIRDSGAYAAECSICSRLGANAGDGAAEGASKCLRRIDLGHIHERGRLIIFDANNVFESLLLRGRLENAVITVAARVDRNWANQLAAAENNECSGNEYALCNTHD